MFLHQRIFTQKTVPKSHNVFIIVVADVHLALCQRDIVFQVSDNEWYNIAGNNWDEYCVSPAAFLVGSAPTPTTMVSTTTPTMKLATPITLRDNFAKSIKKDPEAYPAFKEEAQQRAP